MRGYRLFNDISSIDVEWRIQGFRIRTVIVLWVFFGSLTGGALLLASPWIGGFVIGLALFVAVTAAVYMYRNDPNLVLGEITLISLLWKGARRCHVTNETTED